MDPDQIINFNMSSGSNSSNGLVIVLTLRMASRENTSGELPVTVLQRDNCQLPTLYQGPTNSYIAVRSAAVARRGDERDDGKFMPLPPMTFRAHSDSSLQTGTTESLTWRTLQRINHSARYVESCGHPIWRCRWRLRSMVCLGLEADDLGF